MSGIRQYDIWIDEQKLAADFLPDRYTQAGYRLLLGFDGCVSVLDRKSTTQHWISKRTLKKTTTSWTGPP